MSFDYARADQWRPVQLEHVLGLKIQLASQYKKRRQRRGADGAGEKPLWQAGGLERNRAEAAGFPEIIFLGVAGPTENLQLAKVIRVQDRALSEKPHPARVGPKQNEITLGQQTLLEL